MNEIDSLLSQFQNTSEQSTPQLWGETTEEKPTPESEDGERLEQSIRDVFSNKQLLNKALATFLGVFTANAGVSLQVLGLERSLLAHWAALYWGYSSPIP